MKILTSMTLLLVALAAGADEVSDLIGTNRARTTLEMAELISSTAMPPLNAYTLQMTVATLHRQFVEGSNTFVVEYTYSPFGYCTIPATLPPGKPHYPATIRVTLNGEQFGHEFTGEVVPDGGCFEDMPGDMVDKARHAPPPNPPQPLVGLTNCAVTNFGSLLTTNILTVTNGWTYATNISYTVYTNQPIDTNALYRASRDEQWNYGYKEIDMTGVTNLVQLCAKIGHVWKPGPPDRTQVNNPELARHCILCGKLERHEGEWK